MTSETDRIYAEAAETETQRNIVRQRQFQLENDKRTEQLKKLQALLKEMVDESKKFQKQLRDNLAYSRYTIAAYEKGYIFLERALLQTGDWAAIVLTDDLEVRTLRKPTYEVFFDPCSPAHIDAKIWAQIEQALKRLSTKKGVVEVLG